MNAMIEMIAGLEAADDYIGMQSRLRHISDGTAQLLEATADALQDRRWKTAFILARILEDAFVQHPVAALALGAGGALFNDQDAVRRGSSRLAALVDANSPEWRAAFVRNVAEPLGRELASMSLRAGRDEALVPFAAIVSACCPELRSVFDFDAPVPFFDPAAQAAGGRARARLPSYYAPPAPRPPRRAVVAFREKYRHGDPNSRPHDIGPRICAAMAAYGWKNGFYGLPGSLAANDFVSLAHACLQEQADVLILDDHVVLCAGGAGAGARDGVIALLKKELPGLKTVAFHPDPWLLKPEWLHASAASFDLFWIGNVLGWELWDDAVFQGKILRMPPPHAGNFIAPAAPLTGRMTFAGAIEPYNWHRAYWRAGVRAAGLPVDFQLSGHLGDGLSALDSYAVYMRRLSECGCSVNFSMRQDLTRIVTGRAFESIIAGALLVSEDTPDMDYFFTAGEHYLKFTRFSELAATARFIAERPDEAETIRQRGHAFARECYADMRLIGHLDWRLFGPGYV